MMNIISAIVVGFIVGLIARFIYPGAIPASFVVTTLLGIGGSFVGGLLFSLIAHEGFRLRPSGLIGSFVGALIVLIIWNVVSRMQASGDAKASAADKRAARSGNPAKKGR